ncbi:MAG: glutaredoxin domain-containing protein, partial [Polaromonas sp.]
MQVVKIYTTGSCPYCIQAKALLKQRGVVELDEVRVDMLAGEREK